MHRNKKGFSLIFAITIVIIVSTTSLFLLSFIIPYGRNVKGLENSSKAYYLSSSAAEQAIWDVHNNSLGYEDVDTLSGTIDYGYAIIANGTRIPELGRGNSGFDTDWNRIGFSDPIQLSVGNGDITDWSSFAIDFRVPDLNGNGNYVDEVLANNSSNITLTWQLSNQSSTLLPSNTGAFISPSDINSSTSYNLGGQNGISIDGNPETFSDFYVSECLSSDCILKISLTNPLYLNDIHNTPVPYLEYFIDTGLQSIPTRYTNIDISGTSYGFKKESTIRIPQLTTDQAFDFTVFQ